jgi:hypothetical protein
MRRVTLALVLVWICEGLSALPTVVSPSGSVGEAAKHAGNAMYEAFRKGDLDGFASYTYPGLVKLLGGKEKMVALLKRGRADMEREGARFLSGAVAAPTEIVKAGTELHALLELNQVLAVPGGELHIAGHLLGISGDGGKTWASSTPQN